MDGSLEDLLRQRPRAGDAPRTTPTNPHTQLDQQPTDLELVDALAAFALSLPDVVERPSMISVPAPARCGCATTCPTDPPRRSWSAGSSRTSTPIPTTAST